MGYKYYKMKKLILSLVFVLVTVTMINANTNDNKIIDTKIKMDCVGMAFAASKKAKLTYEQFSAVVEACEAAQ